MARLQRRSTLAGFTLIEVMTVVAVIGILIAIALPNYQEHLLRAKLVDAGSTLAQIRVRLEQYYQDNRSYDADPIKPTGACGSFAAPASKYFDYACETRDSGGGFVATAKGKDGGGTSAFSYTVDQLNNRTSTITLAGWTSGKCWVTSKGQTCE